jgi:hypothetical protein
VSSGVEIESARASTVYVVALAGVDNANAAVTATTPKQVDLKTFIRLMLSSIASKITQESYRKRKTLNLLGWRVEAESKL